MNRSSLERIHFPLDSTDWHGHGGENLWAEHVVGDLFRIKNSPFFARGINHEDVVRAEWDGIDQYLRFAHVFNRGGHSTYMVLTERGQIGFDQRWTSMEAWGCTYESMTISLSIGSKMLYSVDVPPDARLDWVYSTLAAGEKDGIWVFQEGWSNRD